MVIICEIQNSWQVSAQIKQLREALKKTTKVWTNVPTYPKKFGDFWIKVCSWIHMLSNFVN